MGKEVGTVFLSEIAEPESDDGLVSPWTLFLGSHSWSTVGLG